MGKKIMGEKRKIDLKTGSAAEGPREYDFEGGVEEATRRIVALYENTDHDIIVIFNCASPRDVGKTRLRARLNDELKTRNIPVIFPRNTDKDVVELELKRHEMKFQDEYLDKRFTVAIIEGGMEKMFVQSRDAFVEETKLRGTEVVGDLYIALYRSDEPFMPHPLQQGFEILGDIIIRNDHARDKS